MSLTEHLIAARKRAALSQGEVAEALGVSLGERSRPSLNRQSCKTKQIIRHLNRHVT